MAALMGLTFEGEAEQGVRVAEQRLKVAKLESEQAQLRLDRRFGEASVMQSQINLAKADLTEQQKITGEFSAQHQLIQARAQLAEAEVKKEVPIGDPEEFENFATKIEELAAQRAQVETELNAITTSIAEGKTGRLELVNDFNEIAIKASASGKNIMSMRDEMEKLRSKTVDLTVNVKTTGDADILSFLKNSGGAGGKKR